jgi:ribosomal protein S18 acetylase RimI-like enzyme
MNQTSHQLRPFTAADERQVCELILAGLGQRFGTIRPELNPDLVDIGGYYGAIGGYIVVLEELTTSGAMLIGCGMLIPEAGQTKVGRLVRLSVGVAWQGQGWGRVLTEHLLAHGRGQGYTTLWVETNADWHSALHLYQTCGFTEQYRTPHPTHGYTEVQMALFL